MFERLPGTDAPSALAVLRIPPDADDPVAACCAAASAGYRRPFTGGCVVEARDNSAKACVGVIIACDNRVRSGTSVRVIAVVADDQVPDTVCCLCVSLTVDELEVHAVEHVGRHAVLCRETAHRRGCEGFFGRVGEAFVEDTGLSFVRIRPDGVPVSISSGVRCPWSCSQVGFVPRTGRYLSSGHD